jgi:hypothetical protein
MSEGWVEKYATFEEAAAAVRSGDIALWGPADGHWGWFARLIRAGGCGQNATHVEPLCRLERPVCGFAAGVYAGEAKWPRFALTPLAERQAEIEGGKALYGIYRWARWPDGARRPERLGEWLVYSERVGAALVAWGVAQPRYDVPAIVTFARNWLRHAAGAESVLKQRETQIICSEAAQVASEIGGVDPNAELGTPQPLWAPVHFERLVRKGELSCLWSNGLHARIVAG